MFRKIKAKFLENLYNDDNFMNVWNSQEFAMSGYGEKIKVIGFFKQLYKSLKYSKQRATKVIVTEMFGLCVIFWKICSRRCLRNLKILVMVLRLCLKISMKTEMRLALAMTNGIKFLMK